MIILWLPFLASLARALFPEVLGPEAARGMLLSSSEPLLLGDGNGS